MAGLDFEGREFLGRDGLIHVLVVQVFDDLLYDLARVVHAGAELGGQESGLDDEAVAVLGGQGSVVC